MILRLGRRGRAFKSRRSHLILILQIILSVARQWRRVRVMTLVWSNLIGSESWHNFLTNSIEFIISWVSKDVKYFLLLEFCFFWLAWLELVYNQFMRLLSQLPFTLEYESLLDVEKELSPNLSVRVCAWHAVRKSLIKNVQTVMLKKLKIRQILRVL